jgi:peptidoglycan biosynthesis protein MviN/MurJ (putative lipid II flippase)
VVSAWSRLTESVARGDPEAAQCTFNTVTTTVVVLLVPATLLLMLGAPAVVRLLAPGFPAEQVVLTVRLARIVLLAALVVAGTNLLTAMLHAHRRQVWPSLEGLPFNAVMILAALLERPADALHLSRARSGRGSHPRAARTRTTTRRDAPPTRTPAAPSGL